MRLIDADKLIEKLRDFKEWEDDNGRPIHTMSEIQRIDKCINFIQMESTAYDVDKVIKELEDWTFNTDIAIDDTMINRNLIVSETAINIVKDNINKIDTYLRVRE